MESFLEVLVGHGVYDRVDEGVQISQPGEEVKQLGVKARVACGHHQCVNEKRQPAHDVSAEDYPQGLCRFPLSGCRNALFLQERVRHRHLHLVLAC